MEKTISFITVACIFVFTPFQGFTSAGVRHSGCRTITGAAADDRFAGNTNADDE